MTDRPARRWRAALAIAGATAAVTMALHIDGAAHPGGAGVTWPTVAPILERRCVGCHGPAARATPRLDGYEHAAAAAAAIKRAALSRHAPGWHAVRGIRGFTNDRAASPAEAELLAQWADGRAPRGDAAAPVAGEHIPEPDGPSLVLSVDAKHRIESTAHTFILRPDLASAAWIRGWRFEPGNPALVTGAVFALPSGRTLGTWSAGEGATWLPTGTAIELPAASPVHLTVFYRAPHVPAVDASRLRLYLASAPARAARTTVVRCGSSIVRAAQQLIALRPVAASAESIAIELRTADRAQPIARFEGRAHAATQTYWLAEPLLVQRGARLSVRADSAPCTVELLSVEGAAPLGPDIAPAARPGRPATADYRCPMHPDVTADGPGACPRCAMPLVSAAPRVTGEYRLDAAVVRPRARGSAARLRLVAREPWGGAPVREFEDVHERPFHLFIVSADLEDFAHLHPDATADGALEVPFVPRRTGDYRVFADFLPSGGTPQLLARTIVAGHHRADPAGRGVPDLDVAPKLSGGMRIEVRPDGAMRAGDPSLIAFRLSDAASGEPIADLEPYLGAWGHVFIVGSNLEDAVHSHPTTPLSTAAPSELFFSQRFPRAGVYRLWAQFMRRGELTTVAFTLRVS